MFDQPRSYLTSSDVQDLRSRLAQLSSQSNRIERDRSSDESDRSQAEASILELQRKTQEENYLLELLEKSIEVRPGDSLSAVEVPCFVTICIDCGPGKNREEQKILYEPALSEKNRGSGTLNPRTPIGQAIVGQKVGSTLEVSTPGGMRVVHIKAAHKLQAVSQLVTT